MLARFEPISFKRRPLIKSVYFHSIERVLHAILTQRLLFTLGRTASESELDESEKIESMKFNDGPRLVGTVDTEAGLGTTASSLPSSSKY